MELKEFIEETLMQVVEGVKSAQEKALEFGACISPKGMRTDARSNYIHIGQNVDMPLGQIDFEIALTSSDEKESKGGIGVMLAGIGIGGQERTDMKNVSITNIKFSVPVLLSCVDADLDKFYQ
jgi:hypothetical protein